jgi:hypothetical protein
LDTGTSSSGTAVSALRAFRLIKIIKLALRWDSLKLLIDSIAHTISAIGNFTILLCLFIYVYSLLGMQFFAGSVKFDLDGNLDLVNGTSPRANFDSLLWAFVTVFQVLVGDGWTDVMFSCIRSVGWGSTVYFISLMVFGNIILLNLFLAIIIGNFEEASIIMKEMKYIEEKRQALMRQGTSGLFPSTVLEANTVLNSKMFNDTCGDMKRANGNQILNVSQLDPTRAGRVASPKKRDTGFGNIIIREDENEMIESDLEDDNNMHMFRNISPPK